MINLKKIILFFCLIVSSNFSYANENEIKIVSDKLEIIREPLKSIFTGNVYAHDNEVELWADKIIMIFNGPNNKLDIIEAYGNTKIIRENQEIVADKIIYNLTSETINAQGNIVLIEDKNSIIGDELDIDLKNSTSIIKSQSSNRVQAVIIKNDE